MGRWALDVAFVWRAVLTLGLVLLYYCFSIGITFYNKWLTKVTGRPAPRGREGGGGATVPLVLSNRRYRPQPVTLVMGQIPTASAAMPAILPKCLHRGEVRGPQG